MQLPRVIGLSAVACAACVTGQPVQDDGEMDATTLAAVQRYQAMAEITARPYASSVGAFDVATFAAGDVADYRRIHPDRDTRVAVAPGTVIVRAVLDASGAVSKLTVMAKGPPGYDPSIGDWWWGVTDPSGTPLVDDGTPEVGRMTDCHTCHLPRAADDFLFGVPASDE